MIWSCFLAEKIIHEHLAECRTNPRREFFAIELSQAIIAAEYAVERAGARASSSSSSSSVVGGAGGIVASVCSWGWNVTISIFKGTCYTIWFFLKLFVTVCVTLCITLPLAFLTGILAGISKPPRRRRKRQWWE
jgi:hypothetical protein